MQKLFVSYFRGLISKDCDVTVELKNDIEITGKLKYIDDNMCLFLEDISVKDSEKHPQFVSTSLYRLKSLLSVFVRGSNIRAIHLPYDEG